MSIRESDIHRPSVGLSEGAGAYRSTDYRGAEQRADLEQFAQGAGVRPGEYGIMDTTDGHILYANTPDAEEALASRYGQMGGNETQR